MLGLDEQSILAQAGTENFPVALGLVPARERAHLLAIYGFARLADDLGDEFEGDRLGALDWLEADLDAAFAGSARHPLLQRLSPTLAELDLPRKPFVDLIEANRLDQRRDRYRTFGDLLDYCELSANPVGRLVLAVFGVDTPQRRRLSDSVCSGLQVAEHIQDVGEDYAKGRIYLPLDDLERVACPEADLGADRAGPELVRAVQLEVERARGLLAAGDELVSTLTGPARLAVAGFVAGGRAALDAVVRADHDVLAGECRPRRHRVVFRAVGVLLNARRSVMPDEVGAVNVAEAYDRCEQITRREAKNFAYGIRLLPPPKRRAMSALYAYARRIDDVGDGSLPVEEKLVALGRLREEIAALVVGEAPPDDPVLVGVRDAAHRYPVPVEAFEEIVEGCTRDVRDVRYVTAADTEEYCRLVAGSVGRLSLGVFGWSDPRAPGLADDLGVGLQLTNILRDIVEDRSMGRVYLPSSTIESFGCAPDLAGPPHAMRDLIVHQADVAGAWYDTGLDLLDMIDRRSAACVGAMSGIYRRLLDRIRWDPLAVLAGRVSLPTWEKGWVAARSLAGKRP